MWTPPDRRRHPLPEARWPTAAEAATARWFSPLAIGPLTARRRTWVPAMVPWRASPEGLVTDEVVAWYRRFARGKPGVLVVEATGIRDLPSGPLLRASADRFVPGLARLVEAVREASAGETLLFLQLLDFLPIRRRPSLADYCRRFVEVSPGLRRRLAEVTAEPGWLTAEEGALREALLALDRPRLERTLSPRQLEALDYGHRERVTDLHLPSVRELPARLPGWFADGAARAFAAGFDGVELHFAHAYTMASFLSARNDRDDGYGGPREQRVRLPREVVAAVRQRVGEACLGARLLGDEAIAGGSTLDDACFFAVELAAAGLDVLSVSAGGKFEDAAQPAVGAAAYPYTGPSGYACMPTVYSDARGPFGRNVHLAAAIKRALLAAGRGTPVVTAGGITTFELAEAILARGDADLVAAARQTLADPDWFEKVRRGRGAEVRRCKLTNYCEALDQQHKAVTCQLWDRHGLDQPGAPLDATGRRRLVAPDWNPGDD